MMESLIAALAGLCIAALGFFLGFSSGRRHERYRLYDRLLASPDPQSWTAAHHARRESRRPTEESDGYAPTPAGAFPALVDQQAKTVVQRSDIKPDMQ